MRRPLIAVAATAALVASTSGAATAAHAAPPEPTKYLALGDSYPAGVPGAGAQSAYPALLAQRAARTVADNNAVTGATTAGIPSQVTANNDVITLTVGANDLNWVTTLTACAANPTACSPTTNPQLAQAVEQLPVGLGAALTAVRAANPDAVIFVTGYPEPFNAAAAARSTCAIGPLPGTTQDVVVSAGQAAAVNGLVGGLNQIIAGTADQFDATYVNPSPFFTNHRLCDRAPWLYDLDTPTAAFHPTAAGQRAYTQAIDAAGFRKAAHPGTRVAEAVR